MDRSDFIRRTLAHEGGYVNDPNDPGGETNFGISRKFLDSIDHIHINIAELSQDEAISYYEAYFWPGYLDNVESYTLRLMLFDFGVNAGTNRAAKTFQKALRVPEDGIIGPVTLSRANRAQKLHAIKRFAEEILLFYGSLTTFKHFGKSWVRRVIDNSFLEV